MGQGRRERAGMVAAAVIAGLLVLGACVTVDEHGHRRGDERQDDAGPLLKKQIAKRISGLKYQRDVALLDSLNWLILYGAYAVPQLVDALDSPDPRTRSYAAYVLGEIGDQAVVEVLRAKLAGENHKLVRYEMAASLVALGDWGQLGILIGGLEEDSRRYRHKCYEILHKNLNLTFGYDPTASAGERARAVRKWKAWWERNRENFTPVVR